MRIHVFLGIRAALAAPSPGPRSWAPSACPAGHGQPSGGRLPLMLPGPVVCAEMPSVQRLYGLHHLQQASRSCYDCSLAYIEGSTHNMDCHMSAPFAVLAANHIQSRSSL